MDFPWDALFTVIGIGLVLTLVINAPTLILMLFTGFIRFITSLFTKEEDI